MLSNHMVICMCKIRYPQVIKGLQDYLVLSFYVESKYFIIWTKNIFSIYFLAVLGLSCDTQDLSCHVCRLFSCGM